MTRTTATRPLAPTSALDQALEAIAAGDPDTALRWSVPALSDEGAGAAAADIVGRALTAAGRQDLAVDAHQLAIAWLSRQGLAPHAVAAALALRELTKDEKPLEQLAKAYGAGASTTDARPPALKSEAVQPLDKTLAREKLVGRAVTALQTAPRLPEGPTARPKLPLWSGLPIDAFMRFARALTVHVVGPGAVLMHEGDPADGAFIVARGEVRVHREGGEQGEIELAVLGVGSIVGEMALVTEAPRVATVTSTRGGIVLEIPRDALDEAARDVPAVGEQVVAFCHGRLVHNVLKTSAVLRELPADEREGLAQQFVTHTFEPGDVLIAEGSSGTGLHLIAAGQVGVDRADENGEPLRIATLGPGTCVGEISLVLRRPASATVVATEPTVSLVLPADRFLDVVRKRPNLLARLYELAVQREDETLSVVAQEAVEIDDAVIV